ncbi:MAG: ribonuclease P protein component [Lachnospiraceae bacterium]|nr:ribonuclease P protein component [Lachnospiraceae bacterium]
MLGLKKNSDFVAVYHSGKSYANRYLIMYAMKNGMDSVRIGISVSKKVGNSVVRHRVKRLIRESCRLHDARFKQGYDLVIIARRAAAGRSYDEIESAVLHLMSLHHIRLPHEGAETKVPD